MRAPKTNEWYQIVAFLILLAIFFLIPSLQGYILVGGIIIVIIFAVLGSRTTQWVVQRQRLPLFVILLLLAMVLGAIYQALTSIK